MYCQRHQRRRRGTSPPPAFACGVVSNTKNNKSTACPSLCCPGCGSAVWLHCFKKAPRLHLAGRLGRGHRGRAQPGRVEACLRARQEVQRYDGPVRLHAEATDNREPWRCRTLYCSRFLQWNAYSDNCCCARRYFMKLAQLAYGILLVMLVLKLGPS